MRLAFGLVALSASRDEIGYFGDVAGRLLAADDGPEVVPFSGLVPAISTTNVVRAHSQDAQSFKLFSFRGLYGWDDRVYEGIGDTRRAACDTHRRGQLAVSDSLHTLAFQLRYIRQNRRTIWLSAE